MNSDKGDVNMQFNEHDAPPMGNSEEDDTNSNGLNSPNDNEEMHEDWIYCLHYRPILN